MPLADDIHLLRDRTIADLTAAHDYFSNTEAAWNLVRQFVLTNPTFQVQNLATGTVTSGMALAAQAPRYVSGQLTESTFQLFLSIFEVFIGDLLRLWLFSYPRAIGNKTVGLNEALDAGDLTVLINRLIDHEIAEVTYKSPRAVFQYLERRMGLSPTSAIEIDHLAEAKATRDVLVHNRGIVDAAYLTKAGPLARHAVGQQIDIPKPYHRATWELIKKLVIDLANTAATKSP
jgi:hypothetical protein